MGNVIAPLAIPGQSGSRYTESALAAAGLTVTWVQSAGRPDKRVLVASRTVGAAGKPHMVVLYSHGNAEDLLSMLGPAECLANGFGDVLLVSYEYSGYGLSHAEECTEKNILDDAHTAADHVRSIVPEDVPIVIYGRSLGSATAVAAACRLGARCNALVLQSPIVSIVSTKVPPAMRSALGFLDMFDTSPGLSGLRVPLLIAHGVDDSVVPVNNAETIFRDYAGPKELYILPGRHHNDIYLSGDASAVAADGQPLSDKLRVFMSSACKM